MAEARPGDSGGILGLLGLLDEHREAIDYDCLTLGLDLHDLGTERFDWCRLKAVVTFLPSTSALARSMHGERALWTAGEHLLAGAVDALNAANWQRGGGKGKKPRPVPRPGEDEQDQRRFGTGKMSLAEAREFFARVNRPPEQIQLSPVGGCSEDGCVKPAHARGWCSMHYQRWRRAQAPASSQASARS